MKKVTFKEFFTKDLGLVKGTDYFHEYYGDSNRHRSKIRKYTVEQLERLQKLSDDNPGAILEMKVKPCVSMKGAITHELVVYTKYHEEELQVRIP